MRAGVRGRAGAVLIAPARQQQLLFFSLRRRAQDRPLFLYRSRVLDRFYPARPFGCGKPEAHWLLDEACAILVASMHDVERKQFGWQRRDDWGAHPQLAHQLVSHPGFDGDFVVPREGSLRVNSRSEILPTYRVVTDAVCALPSSVELIGHYSNPDGLLQG